MLPLLTTPLAGGGTADCGEFGCWSHGECRRGVCACEAGYGGTNCRTVLDDNCPNNCGGHGRCADTGLCECHAGYYGIDCTYVTPYFCPTNCGGRGFCLADNQTCACDRGFSGAGCEHSDMDCPLGCSGHGYCVDGKCECRTGFRGSACNVLVAHTCADHCSGQGMCRGDTCDCEPDIGGRGCSRVVPYAGCPSACGGHGVCRHGGCQCIEALEYLWEGAGCERLAPLEGCLHSCSGHGTCKPRKGHPGHGVCACHAGFTGAACDTEVHCANRCNGPLHGTCVLGACECQPEWTGAACDVPLCLNNCSAHGACMAPSVDGARPACLCDGGWSGLACDAWVPYCPNDCSSRGECRGGRCACAEGYVGDDCGTLASAAPAAAAAEVASARTALVARAPGGARAAEGGNRTCDALRCNGHGRCRVTTTLLCACFDGFGGASCEAHRGAAPALSRAQLDALECAAHPTAAACARGAPAGVEAPDGEPRAVPPRRR